MPLQSLVAWTCIPRPAKLADYKYCLFPSTELWFVLFGMRKQLSDFKEQFRKIERLVDMVVCAVER